MRLRSKTAWGVIFVVLVAGVGIVANPLLTTCKEQWTAALASEAALALAWISFALFAAHGRDPAVAVEPPTRSGPHAQAWAVLAVVLFLWAWFYRERWTHPVLAHDDLHYVAASIDAPNTWRTLLKPYNEHLVVPTRIWTWAWSRGASENQLPVRLAWSTLPLFAAAAAQLFLLAFARFRSEAVALVVVAVFSLTSVYSEVVDWYAASQWLFPLNLLLWGLRAAESAGVRGERRAASMSALPALMGPFAFSMGALVGPAASLWLATKMLERGRRPSLWSGLPVLATVVALAMVAPILAAQLASEDYRSSGGRGLSETLNIPGGLVLSLRMTLEVLLLENLGVRGTLESRPAQAGLFAALVAAILILLRRRPAAWRIAPSLFLIVGGYAATIPLRTWVSYHDLLRWNRYQLVPQLGVALLVGELAVIGSQATPSGEPRRLDGIRTIGVVALALVLVYLHAGAATNGR